MSASSLADVDGLTLGQALRRSSARWPNQDFFKTADVTVSFLQFDQQVDQFAQALPYGLATHSNGHSLFVPVLGSAPS
jgi:hypothetical protein